MRVSIYPKLAFEGIRKNKKLYFPFFVTCISMISMQYILSFLSASHAVSQMRGSTEIKTVLNLGSIVIAIFSLIFLFYSHSFLIRRRNKEFGLYNILGMDKKNIGIIMLWEMIIVTAVSLFFGIFFGVAFSKLAELGLMNMIKAEINYSFSIAPSSIIYTAVIYCIIFLLILIKSLIQIGKTNPTELFKSESVGEKPPKANWALGIGGVIILAVAYAVALSIKRPLTAFTLFFFAVIAVIVATYLIFIAGSVLLCMVLQKNKNYYYKTNHFVSVSSMIYRMKRNGAGLASICILLTMVIVMISSTACLYFGAEDSLKTRYPRNIYTEINSMHDNTNETLNELSDENIDILRENIERIISESKITAGNISDYRYAAIAGTLNGGTVQHDSKTINAFSYDSLHNICFIPLADYNRMMGTNEKLGENQVLIYPSRSEFKEDTLTISGVKSFKVKKVLYDFFDDARTAMDIVPTVFVVVNSYETDIKELMSLSDYNGEAMLYFHWIYGFDTDAKTETQIETADLIHDMLKESSTKLGNGYSFSVECREEQRTDFYGTFGSLFFLGIVLSLIFIIAAVLIIYYKQISEGYEDKPRFEIMQKVGMTKTDIKKSINSQMLTVFLFPLIVSVIHYCFAFPIICKLLTLFNMYNTTLFIITSAISIAAFALLYMFVYKITSRIYYSIVSGQNK